MKVAIFVHCFFPEHFYGTETYTLQLATQLRAMGHDAMVVSAIFQGEPPRKALLSKYEYQNIPVYCIDKNFLPHSRVKETFYQENMHGVFQDFLRETSPDIVHVTHLINHTAVLLEVVKEFRIPMVATLTDFFGFCFTCKLEAVDGALCSGPNPTASNCLACYMKESGAVAGKRFTVFLTTPPFVTIAASIISRFTDFPWFPKGTLSSVVEDLRVRPEILLNCYKSYRAIIAPTRFLKEAYQANGFSMRCFESKFGVDIDRSPKPARSSDGPLVFGYIGQISPHKGIDILLTAFTMLASPRSELHIYGAEDQAPDYSARLRAAVGDRLVRFLGTFPKERMGEIFASLDVLVIPSRWYENSPLVLLYALASHTPVVVADVAGLTEFIEIGRNGFVFSRGSAAALESALRHFVDDCGLASRMSRSTEYRRTSRDMVEDVLPVYRYAMKRSS